MEHYFAPNTYPFWAILIILGPILYFLLLREFTLWYFKINRIVSLLESIDSKLGDTPPAIIEKDSIFSPEFREELAVAKEKSENKPPLSKRLGDALKKEYYVSDFLSTKKKDKEE
jgi:hypothetical protein